jgi:hypothetical protein
MRKLAIAKGASLAAAAMFMGGQAYGFTATFPSNSSTVVGSVGSLNANEIGYFWSASRGDKVEQTFNAGYASVVGLTLDFDVTQNVLSGGAFVNWDVRVNGTSVGSWMRTDAQGTGHVSLSFSFAAIAGVAGNYTVGMHVTNEVASGFGSIALSKERQSDVMSLRPVPEPATMAALGIGVVAMLRRRRAR